MAIRTLKGFLTCMLSHVHFEIASGIVFLITAFDRAAKLIFVKMGSFMVSENPLLSEIFVASFERADKFDDFTFVMSGEMVSQVLWHLE
jgi:hypothetical protein